MVLIHFLNELHFLDATLQSVQSRNSKICVITRYMRIIIIKKLIFWSSLVILPEYHCLHPVFTVLYVYYYLGCNIIILECILPLRE